jgi:hypothetical protein
VIPKATLACPDGMHYEKDFLFFQSALQSLGEILEPFPLLIVKENSGMHSRQED